MKDKEFQYHRNFVELCEQEQEQLLYIQQFIEDLHKEHPFSEKTFREVTGRLSSKYAQIERSIQHNKNPPTGYSGSERKNTAITNRI